MRYIQSSSTDPRWNLALEEYAFDRLASEGGLFMLWRNENAVIVGKHQNTFAEVRADEIAQRGTHVVRRLSGGGAVYHDLGNVNFTFVMRDDGKLDFAAFCRPVQQALAEMGVTSELSGRNDMTIEGKKFSGNSQYRKNGYIMHHGTLLYDSDLSTVAAVLQPDSEKLAHKGLKSVRSRVSNIKPFSQNPLDTPDFMTLLRKKMTAALSLTDYALTDADCAEVEALMRRRYATWDWNYGSSPAHNAVCAARFEGVGKVEVYLTVEKGRIAAVRFCGDFFEGQPLGELEALLAGRSLQAGAFDDVQPEGYILGLTSTQLSGLLLA
jgi:lipoyltransferase and lipoate-protein ligase